MFRVPGFESTAGLECEPFGLRSLDASPSFGLRGG